MKELEAKNFCRNLINLRGKEMQDVLVYLIESFVNSRGDFMADSLTKEQRHKNMQNIRGKDTKIEVILRKALWNKGYRY